MIPVLLRAAGPASDGLVFADPPNTTEFDLPDNREVLEDCYVQVVPQEALQLFLSGSPKFQRMEQRFGRLSAKDKAILRGLFALLEQIRSTDPGKRDRYYAYLLLARREERKEAKVKRTRQESENIVRYLFEHDRKTFEQRGPLKELIEHLQWRGSLRVWMDNRTKTLAPGVLAFDFNDALLDLLLLNLANSSSVAICPKCTNQFVRSKSTQIFCSARCANNDRKARQRSRERDQKEIKNVPRKAR